VDEQNGPAGAKLALIVAAAALVMVGACCLGLPMLAGGAAAGQQATTATGTQLRRDAPVPPEYLAYVLAAGALCPEIGPAEIAAQIDLESSWNPNAYADSGEVPAMGIAQFTAATWSTWGHDYDGDGTNSPYDPGDAIPAQGHLMCDLVDWAKQNLTAKPPKLHGDVLDLAWAAYFDGRAGILAAGGVPASGLAHDYPQQVRDRLPKYAADGGDGLPGDGSGGIPAGYVLPSNAQQAAAVSFALAQLGKPYVFGAAGPNSYDCSGLVMAAWAHAGIHIPRVTTDQVHTGMAVASLADMQPGDLIFIPGSDGTMAAPGHVGMYIGRGGDGNQYLVQAPHTGDVVKVSPVRSWSQEIAGIRRPLDH
jgi:cell wall-associated NlpC family hydrolase